VIQPLWWNDRTFDQAIPTWARFFILTLIAYVNDTLFHGELEVVTYVRVEAHDSTY